MKKLISILVICLPLLVFSQDKDNDIYKLFEGKNYLTHIEKSVSASETITFSLHKGREYEIIFSSKNATVELENTTIELKGKMKSITLTGNGVVNVKIYSNTKKNQKIIIGICYTL